MDTNRRTSAASQSQEVQYDEVDYSRPWRGTPSVPHLHCFNAGRPKRNGWVEPYVGRVSMLSLANVDARAQVMEMDQLQLYRKFDHNLLWDNSILRCGMRFKGKQTNNGSRFHVDVEMQDINFDAGTCSGYMTVQGISEDIPELETFFTGHIIGKHHSFHTGQWGSTSSVDRKHWKKFGHWERYAKAFPDDTIDYEHMGHDKAVFMRWKEKFLVEDHTKTHVRGASFAGFYYIMYDCDKNTISGFYYHKDSDWFQTLDLAREEDVSPMHTYEYR
ncbi:glucose-induced degradation protein 4 homolog [Sycon ciliatum]|uniref:glucose-induced degradation protein 4 homolog n=1 Tax=Sycon ciliatum TaxID=27933 RepID=UPI0031F6EF9C